MGEDGAVGTQWFRRPVRWVRAVANARGAGESGLGRVLGLHWVSTAADTLIVTALASTIFFAVPTDQARGRVATSLLVTMVPFVLLAPLIGPLLDRVPHGRRYALATTMVVRAFLAWVMAGAVGSGDRAAISLYPAAFGFLVFQKAYLVTRSAALPRVLPRGESLVAGNSRVSMAGVVAMAVAAPVGAGLTAWVGGTWTLRLAFAVFAAGTGIALALPAAVDSSAGERAARLTPGADQGHRAWWNEPSGDEPGGRPRVPSAARPVGRGIGPRVVLGLRANAALRAFSGFLTLFLAFRLRTDPLGDLGAGTSVGLVLVLAGAGGAIGTSLGSVLRRARPDLVIAAVVALTALAAGWAALGYGLWPVSALCLVTGLVVALAKQCLDALIQDTVPEQYRTSAFARSETVLQLAWVLGGGVGLVLPLSGQWGLGVATAAMGAVGLLTLLDVRRVRLPGRPRRPAARSRPSTPPRDPGSGRGAGRSTRRPGP